MNQNPFVSIDFQERASRVRLIVLDVDGVLSDGRIIVDDDGREQKNFHVRDGSALAGWIRTGGQVAILSGRRAQCVEHRAKDLGIQIVLQGNPRKLAGFQEILERTGLSASQTCFMGDDLPDLPLFSQVGLAACPADAVDEVRQQTQFISTLRGGQGAVHELVRHLMITQGLWQQHVHWYFSREEPPRGQTS